MSDSPRSDPATENLSSPPVVPEKSVLASDTVNNPTTEIPSGALGETLQISSNTVPSRPLATPESDVKHAVPTPNQKTPATSVTGLGIVGRFELRRQLGEGSGGTVYLAHDPMLERSVAVKVPKFPLGDRKSVERFLREARSASRLRHPNIVTVFESGEAETKCYLVFEYIAGETLLAKLKGEPVDIRQAAIWVRDLADALSYAHREGVVHRDIKPSNIILDSSGRPLLMDFGVARRIDADATMTSDGGLLGTPAYMSPEQALGDRAVVGPASDQYSLGVVLYEMLTGQRPFSGPTYSILGQVVAAEPRGPRELNREVPRDLEAICLKAMAKKSADRYLNASEFALDLQCWLDGQPVQARPIGPLKRAGKWCRRNQTVVVAATIVFLVVAASVAWNWFKPPEPSGVIELTLVVQGLGISLDGTLVSDEQAQKPLLVRPGKHTLVVSLQGKELERHLIKILPGDVERITLGAKSEPTPQVSALPPPGKDPLPSGDKTPSNPPMNPTPVPPTPDANSNPRIPTIGNPSIPNAKSQVEAAAQLGCPVSVTNSLQMEFRLVPAGEMNMGTDPKQGQALLDLQQLPEWYERHMRNESPAHQVRITRPFFLASREISRGDFQKFLNETKHARDFDKDGRKGQQIDESNLTDDHPAINVSWNDAVAFCEWLSLKEGRRYRLPTEAEWELACRAGSTTQFSYGDDLEQLDGYAWTIRNSEGRPQPRGALNPNAFGLYDMHGNVWEWCSNHFELNDYTAEPAVDPTGPVAGTARRYRGGSFAQYPLMSRSAARLGDVPEFVSSDIGFRIACDAGNWVDVSRQKLVAWLQSHNALARWEINGQETELIPATDLPDTPVKFKQIKLFRTPLMDDELRNLSEAISLRDLNLSGTGITDAGLRYLSNLTELEALGLEELDLNGEGLHDLVSLSRLTSIGFGGDRNLRGKGFAALSQFKELRALFLHGVPFDNDACQHIRNLANLQLLDIVGSKVNDEGLKAIAAITSLNDLALSNTNVTDAGLQQLKSLQGLGILRLGGTRITNAGLKVISELPSLHTLDIWGTDISDEGLQHLLASPVLFHLDLRESNISDAGLNRLQSLKTLRWIGLTDAKTTEAGRQAFQVAIPECVLEVEAKVGPNAERPPLE
ncbi:MAG: hypothetical protein JWM11_2577 [Planctomycetaceae bacterium]|nr:hypothetical protein [Planctomycetaceae bacterium]